VSMAALLVDAKAMGHSGRFLRNGSFNGAICIMEREIASRIVPFHNIIQSQHLRWDIYDKD
jgi:hypothetical protein